MGAYGEHSSRLRNFEGFKLVTNLKETKEAKCNYIEIVKTERYQREKMKIKKQLNNNDKNIINNKKK